MFDIVLIADPVKDMMESIFLVFLIGKLDAVIGQNGMYFVGYKGDKVAKEICCDCPCLTGMQLTEDQF